MEYPIAEAARRVATCKPGKPGLASFSETLALFFIQFLLFRKMKVQDRQNGPLGLPEKSGWLRACRQTNILICLHEKQIARRWIENKHC